MTRVVILDYGSGNLRSVAKAFLAAAESLPCTIEVTQDPETLRTATHIVLPGVGAYGDCMRGVMAVPGLFDALCEQVLRQKKWFLGICVGMQLLSERGLEHGEHRGLGWIQGVVRRFNREDPALKIPHMGWNRLCFLQPEHPLLKGIAPESDVYFVHSYVMETKETGAIVAEARYGEPFPAIVARGNILGVQFHPEKSQAVGLAILRNFLSM